MADRPTVTTLASGALYDTTTLNTNFTALRDHFDTVLGLNGTSGDNNTMTGDVDFDSKIARNVTLDDPTNTVVTNPDGSAGSPSFSFTDDSDTGIFRSSSGVLGFSSNGSLAFSIGNAGSVVNYIQVIGSTTSHPIVRATGTTATLSVVLKGKSDTGGTIFWNGSNDVLGAVVGVASAVNYIAITPSVTTADVSLDATGTDTNIDMALNPKGTGGVVVGAATGGGQGTDTVNAANYFINGVAISGAGVPRSYLAGYGLSNNGTDANKDIDIAVGECRDAVNAEDMVLASAVVKQLDASWVTGTNQGGLSSSLTAAADTWYYVYAITVSGTVDVGFDTSTTAVNLVADHTATSYRRIGAFLTDSGTNIIGFQQQGDEFLWDNPPLDIDTTGSTTGTNRTLSIPAVQVTAIINVALQNDNVYFSSPDVDNEAPSSTAGPLSTWDVTSSGLGGSGSLHVRANTSSQIRERSSGTSTLRIATLGWVDRRGRDD